MSPFSRRTIIGVAVIGVLALVAVFALSTSIALADEIGFSAVDLVDTAVFDQEPPPPGEPAPRDPDPQKCLEACKQRAQRLIRQCVADGGSKERCEKRGAEFARECVQSNCPRQSVEPKPVPVPDPQACKERCELQAREYYRRCLASSTGATPAECERKAKRFLEACVQRKCPQRAIEPREPVEPREPKPDPVRPAPVPDPEACKEKCEKSAQEFYRKCTAGSIGRVAPEDCGKKARELLQTCQEKCDPPTRPEPDACELRCQNKGRTLYAECIDKGGAPERCRTAAGTAVRQCIVDHCP